MSTIVDVNVVFPILLAWHAHHEIAWRWWNDRLDGKVSLCWPVRLGVLRLLTNPKAMNGRPVSPDQALEAWRQFARDPRTRWTESVPSSHEQHFRNLVAGRTASPNLWTDAWLAALSISAAFRLTSFDAGFRVFGLTNFEHLLP